MISESILCKKCEKIFNSEIGYATHECQPSTQQEPSGELMCPNCGNVCDIATERRPNGDSECSFCGHRGTTKSFSVPSLESRISSLQSQLLKAEAEVANISCDYNELMVTNETLRDKITNLRVALEKLTGHRFYPGEDVLVTGPVFLGTRLQESDEPKRGRVEAFLENGTDGVEFFDVDSGDVYTCSASQLRPYRGEMGPMPPKRNLELDGIAERLEALALDAKQVKDE